MRAAYLERKAGAEALVFGELPEPRLRKGEVLVKVMATSVMPTELLWFPTFTSPSNDPRPFPVVLSHEFSGVVAKLGPGVAGFAPGDAVFGFNDWFANGAQAEYCAASASALARKPKSLDHVHAAVVPISALTAWQGLFTKTKLRPGERVLIHGGAGGVGLFGVQLAHWHGARVSATAAAEDRDFVSALGADEVIDYRATRFEDAIHDVDVVFDTIGGDTLERSWSVLAAGGRVVTIATQSEGASDARVRAAFMLVQADGAQLAQIAALIDAGTLRAFTAGVYVLAEARRAYARAEQGKMHGKIALLVAPEGSGEEESALR